MFCKSDENNHGDLIYWFRNVLFHFYKYWKSFPIELFNVENVKKLIFKYKYRRRCEFKNFISKIRMSSTLEIWSYQRNVATHLYNLQRYYTQLIHFYKNKIQNESEHGLVQTTQPQTKSILYYQIENKQYKTWMW